MGQPDVSPRKLAINLGAGLDAVVPHDVEISVVGTVVRIRKRGTPWGMDADMRPLLTDPQVQASGQAPRPGEPSFEAEFDEIVSVSQRIRRTEFRRVSAPARAPRLSADEAADLLVGILDQVQDQVAETITEPWPAVAPAAMPEPFAEIRDGRLTAGFGDPADPTLMLLSAALDDLR
jgi:hypothetical protein